MPKKVQNAYLRTILPALRSAPDQPDPPRIKRIKAIKRLWRIRVSDDYRLAYTVDRAERLVTMHTIGHRDKFYDRLGVNEDGTPGIRIIASDVELLEREPTAEERGNALIALGGQPSERDDPAPERPLPEPLNAETLENWSVPPKYHEALGSARTEGDLLGLGGVVPDEILERVLDGLWPRSIEEIVQQPVRLTVDPSELEAAADGRRSLESFLLKLDDEQKDFVARFDAPRPNGPWLLKGGPGSGKSTVALYCIQSLVRRANSELPLDNKPLRVLFTTFTNSLVNASDHLLKALAIHGNGQRLDVRTVDSLAFARIPQDWKDMEVEKRPREFSRKALAQCRNANPKFSFSERDAEFLEEEVDWVIVGQGLATIEEYLEADRSGRGRALGQQQRRQAWAFFEAFQRLLRDKKVCLFSERLQKAEQHVTPEYDYVFIDEAQDLKPVAIRFCIGLCRNPSNVFLTADTNQSIYGNGLSWSKVQSDMRFQGRARILRRNYRTTDEIWQAIARLAPDGENTDRETLDVETVFHGPFPVLARYSNAEAYRDRLNSYLHEALRQVRAAPGAAAVLCPTKREVEEAIHLINPRFKAKAMISNNVDLGYPGVKVLTMHAAKGLQFPVVAVVGVEAGRMPLPVRVGIDPDEHNMLHRRLLFVACSRAMRQLIVFANRERPSPFIAEFSDEQWEIENL